MDRPFQGLIQGVKAVEDQITALHQTLSNQHEQSQKEISKLRAEKEQQVQMLQKRVSELEAQLKNQQEELKKARDTEAKLKDEVKEKIKEVDDLVNIRLGLEDLLERSNIPIPTSPAKPSSGPVEEEEPQEKETEAPSSPDPIQPLDEEDVFIVEQVQDVDTGDQPVPSLHVEVPQRSQSQPITVPDPAPQPSHASPADVLVCFHCLCGRICDSSCSSSSSSGD